jgi:hypothetical protein
VLRALRRSWCLGSEGFKQQKLEEIDGQVGQYHFGHLRPALSWPGFIHEQRYERRITYLRRPTWQQLQRAVFGGHVLMYNAEVIVQLYKQCRAMECRP